MCVDGRKKNQNATNHVFFVHLLNVIPIFTCPDLGPAEAAEDDQLPRHPARGGAGDREW